MLIFFYVLKYFSIKKLISLPNNKNNNYYKRKYMSSRKTIFNILIDEHIQKPNYENPEAALYFLITNANISVAELINFFEEKIKTTPPGPTLQKIELLFDNITLFLWQTGKHRRFMLNNIANHDFVPSFWSSFLKFNNLFNKDITVNKKNYNNYTITPALILSNSENITLKLLSYLESLGNFEYEIKTDYKITADSKDIHDKKDTFDIKMDIEKIILYSATLRELLIEKDLEFLMNVLHLCSKDTFLEELLITDDFIQNPIIQSKLKLTKDYYDIVLLDIKENGSHEPKFSGLYLALKHSNFVTHVVNAIETSDDKLFIAIMNACTKHKDIREAIIQRAFFKSSVLEKMKRIYLSEIPKSTEPAIQSPKVTRTASPAKVTPEQSTKIEETSTPHKNTKDLEAMERAPTSSDTQLTTSPPKSSADQTEAIEQVSESKDAFTTLLKTSPEFVELILDNADKLPLFTEKQVKSDTNGKTNRLELDYHPKLDNFSPKNVCSKGIQKFKEKFDSSASLLRRLLFFFCGPQKFEKWNLSPPPHKSLVADLTKLILPIEYTNSSQTNSITTSPVKATESKNIFLAIVNNPLSDSNTSAPAILHKDNPLTEQAKTGLTTSEAEQNHEFYRPYTDKEIADLRARAERVTEEARKTGLVAPDELGHGCCATFCMG